MSFFDDDEPTRPRTPRAARPRRPAPAEGVRPRPSEEQAIRQRRLIALGGGIVVVLVLVLGINSCLDSRKTSALKDYNRNVAAVIVDGNRQVAAPFFRALKNGATQPAQLQQAINQLRLTAEEEIKQAEAFDVPGDMQRAQNYLLLALDLRAESLAKIADRIPSAKADGRDNAQTAETAVAQIAGQMRALDASDVIYSQRVAPYIRDTLGSADITGQTIATSQFLPDLGWLNVDQVAGVLGAQRASGGRGASANPAPGLHGHGLTGVSVGSTTLQPGGTVNRLTASSGLAFTVKFANQGDNDESEVVVKVSVKGAGSKAIVAQRSVAQTKSKQPAQVTIPLGQAPPIGQAATITVTIEKVPGETNTTNNTSDYVALFSR